MSSSILKISCCSINNFHATTTGQAYSMLKDSHATALKGYTDMPEWDPRLEYFPMNL